MVLISLPWPFEQCGTNIIDFFPRAVRGYKFVVVAMDYFTKWVKAELLVTIMEKAIQKVVC